jgi:uncharacterized Zn finger protein (UPF0148 family)
MQIDCEKCMNKVSFQSLYDQPLCRECGHTGKIPWTKIIEKVGLLNMLVEGNHDKTHDGKNQLYIFIEKKEEISCIYCKSKVDLKDAVKLDEVMCSGCNRKLEFQQIPELGSLIFYDCQTQQESVQDQKSGIIAFNCHNCGGPLKADSKRGAIFCEFCGTQNEIKRTSKIPVSQMLVARRKELHPRNMAFGNNGTRVTQALKVHGKTAFSPTELNKILRSNCNELSVFHTILQLFDHTPEDEVVEYLFKNSTNREIVIQTAGMLGKSEKEIAQRLAVKNK